MTLLSDVVVMLFSQIVVLNENGQFLGCVTLAFSERYPLNFLIGAYLTLNLPTTTIVAQPFNVIEWQLKFNPVA